MDKILVVDDEPDIRTMVRVLLESRGFDVDEAGDGAQAMELFEPERYRALVLDQRMPGLSGFEVARAVRAAGFLGPIIFFSAFVDDTLERRLIDEVNYELTLVRKTDHPGLMEAVGALAS